MRPSRCVSRGAAHGQTLHPVASTRSPDGVPSQASVASGTPSWSESPLRRMTGSVVVVDEEPAEVVEVVAAAVVVEVEDVVVDDGRVVDVLVDDVVVCVVEVVDVVVIPVVVVVETIGTSVRQVACATLWLIRSLTVLPKTRSMFDRPPASRWQ